MKFHIRRTSDNSDKQPWPTAILVDDLWTIEIDTIERLKDFVFEAGEVVIGDMYNFGVNEVTTPNTPELYIEIYDGYRE